MYNLIGNKRCCYTKGYISDDKLKRSWILMPKDMPLRSTDIIYTGSGYLGQPRFLMANDSYFSKNPIVGLAIWECPASVALAFRPITNKD